MTAPPPTPSSPRAEGRVASIDLLRGLAALAVCWFHLTGSAGPADPAIVASGRYGEFGVDVFFVISGFVIPFSLQRSGYRLGDFWRFLLKRVARVDPPYLASVAVAIGMAHLVSLVPGSRAVFRMPSAEQVLLHVGYAVPFVRSAEWLNPVFWTLAVEFQYYLVIGLAYPLIASRREAVSLLTTGVLLVSSALLPQKEFFPAHAALFVLGIYIFRHRAGLSAFGVLLAVVCVALVAATVMRGVPAAVAGALAAVAILTERSWARRPLPPALLLLGSISYSLYLLHWPVGIDAVAASRRLLPPFPGTDLLARLVGLVASLVAAYAFYRLIEKPAQRVASRVGYRARHVTHDSARRRATWEVQRPSVAAATE